jgi:tRNA(Ile)-lysidine synthase
MIAWAPIIKWEILADRVGELALQTDQNGLEQSFLAVARRLWPSGTTLVVGVSGGADSMALLTLLVNISPMWPAKLIPVHVDHSMRPDSAADAAWVSETLRERFGLYTAVVRLHLTRGQGESWEMAARTERYRVLQEYRRDAGDGSLIAVAHHRRDQAETVLMRLITGTGVSGLQAMRSRSGGLVRPLLDFPPQALRGYLQEQKLGWREDLTNQDPYWLRNRIRLELLPLLRERFNPRVEEALVSLAAHAQETSAVVRSQAQQYVQAEKLNLSCDPLELPASFAALYPAVQADILESVARARGVRLGRDHIRHAQEGRANWPGGIAVSRRSNLGWRIAVAAPAPRRPLHPVVLPEVGTVPWAGSGIIRVESEKFVRAWPGVAQIDFQRWPRLAARGWRNGDRMELLGMPGHHKKLQDIFMDAKIPEASRHQWPVIVSAQGEEKILAIPGIALAEAARCKIHHLCTRIQYLGRDFSM